MYSAGRYNFKENQIKVEALIHNVVHKDTGKYIFPFHMHDDFMEVSLILEGEETIEYENRTYHAKKGDIIIKNAGVLHQETAKGETLLEEITLGVSGIEVEGLPANTLIRRGISPVIPAGEEADLLKALFMHTIKLYEKSVSLYSDLIHLSIRNFLSIVALKIEEHATDHNSSEALTELVSDVINYIDSNYRKQISLDDIAKEFFVSPYYLARQFKKEIGYSVNQYIQNRRLGEAERRLVFEDTSIKEIAIDCGYGNLKYFYSVFKTKTGHTPLEFRTLMKLYRK